MVMMGGLSLRSITWVGCQAFQSISEHLYSVVFAKPLQRFNELQDVF